MKREDAPAGAGARAAASAELRCPRCGERNPLRIAYGYPIGDMVEAAGRGEIALGGCVMSSASPNWRCRGCGRAWSDGSGPSFEGAAGIWLGGDPGEE